MSGLWIVIAAVCVAFLSKAQPLYKETTEIRKHGLSEILQEQMSANQNDKNKRNAMKSKSIRHIPALLKLPPSSLYLKSSYKRKIFNPKSILPSNGSWALEAVSKAAAYMLSHHLSQCLAVVISNEDKNELKALLTTLDTLYVPHLLLLKRNDLMAPDIRGKRSPFSFDFHLQEQN